MISKTANPLAFEQAASAKGFQSIAGVDEAGRGPLAGPVVAAACILPQGLIIDGVDDSKKLSPKKRAALYEVLTTHPEIDYGIGIIPAEVIDEVNILQATIQAMIIAVDALKNGADYLLVDGLLLPHPTTPGEKIIKGDSKSHSIAAASIIAKETRDRLMKGFHERWPEYGFAQHNGYGTVAHRHAIDTHGPCPIHRKTFEPIKSLLLG